MNELLEMGKKLLLEVDIDIVLTKAMDFAIEICHAERGLILFFDNHDQIVFQTFRNLAHEELQSPEFEISHTIIEQTKKTAKPVCLKNACAEPEFNKSKSVARLRLLSVVCIPLVFKEKIFGLIYLDNRSVRGIFSQEHCSMLLEFADFILLAALRAFEIKKLRNSITELEITLRQRCRFEEIIGHNPHMLEILETIAKLTQSDVPVLIQGETGTGKELIARALHFNSQRSARPFIPINCAAIPETLIEAELFGHVRGAFTGALHDKEGIFQQAEGGTVFLDEISALSLNLQPKLLRILQNGEYKRLGGDELRFCNVRIVAASSADLHELVLSGRFRDDLYYRINVIEVTLPPLRQRKDDIPLLVDHFLQTFKAKYGKKSLRISAEARAELLNYDYPGNVRELENIIQRAVTLAEDDLLEFRHLPPSVQQNLAVPGSSPLLTPFRESKRRLLEKFERDYIVQSLKQNNGNISRAAELAGMNVKNFYTKMKKYHLHYAQFRK